MMRNEGRISTALRGPTQPQIKQAKPSECGSVLKAWLCE